MSSQKTDSKGSEGLDRTVERLEAHRSRVAEAKLEQSLRGQRARLVSEKFLTRILSGAIYAICVIGSLFLGTIPTAIVTSAIAWLCTSELFRIARKGGRMPNDILGLCAAVLFPLCPLLSKSAAPYLFFLALLIATLAVWYVFTPRANLADVAISLFAPLYCSLMLSSIVLIRVSEPGWVGALLTLGVMGSIWLNDTGAFLVGSRIGKHKLAPKISPNKSIEGLWGGLIFSIVIWLILSCIGFWNISWYLALGAGILVGLASVVGDLFESRIKRGVGIKDSGSIMPGHGGMLDRTDSLIFGTTVAYFLLHIGGII